MDVKFTILMQDEVTKYKKILSWEDDTITQEDSINNWRVASVEAGNALHSNHVVGVFNEEEAEFDDCPF